tara:strand:- start:291 stop:1721 length:1431 start_codon:yes stop_codon:yes gene_type:complete
MNNKLKKIIIVFFTLLLIVFLINIFIKGFKTNKTNITNMHILNYIPNDYDFTIISNSTNNDIKNYINKNITKKKQDELNIIKDSIISYLGFDLQEKLEDIYDNEFALSFFNNKLNKNDILLIFKLKKNKEINNIVNIGEELNKSEQIIELKRLGKLNYVSHILKTNDNYIIASSNKKLIDSSLQSNNDFNKILSKNLMDNDIKFEEIKLLSISKTNLNSELQTINEIITIINSEDNKIKLRSFSKNIHKANNKILNNQNDNIKDIIFTNKYSKYKKNINYLYNNINQKEFIEEISQNINDQLLFITNNNNWVLCFKSNVPNKISIDQFDFLKQYQKEELSIKNINYSIYTNKKLKIKDGNIIYEEEHPIFSLRDDENTYISNNFDTLQNIIQKTSISDEYLNNYSEIKSYKYILNDRIFINNINNDQLIKYNKYLKNIKTFINTELISLEDININISQVIPEKYETLYLESHLKIL